jgi:hypothetical protein
MIDIDNKEEFNQWYQNIFQFEEVRYKVLLKNFVIRLLLKEFKNKYGKKIGTDEFEKAVGRLASLLNINYPTVYALLKKYGLKVKPTHGEFFIIIDGTKTIYQPGYYVRINPWCSKDDWTKQFEKVAEFVNSHKIELSPLVNKDEMMKKRAKNPIGYKGEQNTIKTYIQIENKLERFWDEKGMRPARYKDTNTFVESDVAVVLGAIEEIVGEKGLKSFDREGKLKEKLQKAYYTVTERYRLPKISDYQKLRQLLFQG